MDLETLHQQAILRRKEAVEFCDGVGFRQHSTDIMGSWETVIKSSTVNWATGLHGAGWKPGTSIRARNTEKMRVKIASMARAIEVYLYAKKHGVEAAMIWKLSR